MRASSDSCTNADQGSQFTGFAFTGRLQAAGVRISMDGRGRCMDNIFIERLALDGKTPAEAYRSNPPSDMMDKLLRALPTPSQAQQQRQEDLSKEILAV